METVIIIIEFLNKIIPLFGRLLKWIKEGRYQKMDIKEIQKRAHILFIDDQTFDKVKRLEEAGWIVETIKDVKTASDFDKINRSHVIFVDYKGVGKYISPTEEGIGLIKNLKKNHPSKRVILYSAHNEFTLADELNHKVADDILPKNSDPYVYLEKIEENARIALSL